MPTRFNKKKSKPLPKVEDLEDEDDDILDDEDEEEEVPKKKVKKNKVAKKKPPVVVAEEEDDEDEDDEEDEEDLDEEDDEEEEEEEEDEKPVKKKKGGLLTAASRNKAKKQVEEDDEEEDEESDEDEEDERPVKKSSAASFYTTDAKAIGAKGSNDRFSFTDGVSQNIMFASDKLIIYSRHWLGKGAGMGFVTCPALGQCPVCLSGNQANQAVGVKVFLVTGSGKKRTLTPSTIIEGAKFGKKVEIARKKQGTLKGIVYSISKIGAKQELEWDFELVERAQLTKDELEMHKNFPIDLVKKITPPDNKALRNKVRSAKMDEDED